jgi:hypothetical protein
MSKMKMETVLAVLAFAAIVYMVYNYSSAKSISGMTDQMGSSLGGGAQPPDLFSSSAGSADGLQTSSGKQMSETPGSLLPKDGNSAWATNPSGNGALQGIGLLKAGALVGIDTVGSTLRNPNLQLRSEFPNPRSNTGPWNQSTIEGDPFRPCLEIGCTKN